MPATSSKAKPTGPKKKETKSKLAPTSDGPVPKDKPQAGSSKNKPQARKSKERRQSMPDRTNPQSGGGGCNRNGRSVSDPTGSATPSIDPGTPPTDLVELRPKLHGRFYEALAILHMLGPNRGERTEEEALDADPDPSDLDKDKDLRRSFVKNLAYVCDYEKGGDSVTAIALEKTPQNIIYRVASNKSAGGAVIKFLEGILNVLKEPDRTTKSQAESTIFAQCVKYASPRISQYIKMLSKELYEALRYLNQPVGQTSSQDTSLRDWLQDLSRLTKSPVEICQFCYDSRKKEQYNSLHARAMPGMTRAKCFETIRHLVGRLNHTLKATKVLVSASSRLPDLFEDFLIILERSPSKSQSPLRFKVPTLDGIVGRMVSGPNEIEKYRIALSDFDRKFELSLSEKLQSQYLSPNWRPRVHAELILLDLFWTKDLKFVDDDRYIGCSKPACYCCFQYIKAHPGRFVIPACHNNNYMNWRPPDIRGANNETLIKSRENIINEMVKNIRAEALFQIIERKGPNKWRPDSLTEITSSRV